jgi:hypothetical protein
MHGLCHLVAGGHAGKKSANKKRKLPAGTCFVSTANSFRGGEENRQGLVAGLLLRSKAETSSQRDDTARESARNRAEI